MDPEDPNAKLVSHLRATWGWWALALLVIGGVILYLVLTGGEGGGTDPFHYDMR